jgi:hypothetical protein
VTRFSGVKTGPAGFQQHLYILLQHTLAIRGGYVLENHRERQKHDARSWDIIGKMGLGEPQTRETWYLICAIND